MSYRPRLVLVAIGLGSFALGCDSSLTPPPGGGGTGGGGTSGGGNGGGGTGGAPGADAGRPAPDAAPTFTLGSGMTTVIAGDLRVPRDLAFNPMRPKELWVVTAGDNATTIIHNAPEASR